MTDLDDRFFKVGAGFVYDGAVLVEDGPAAGTAVVVTFVCGRKVVVVNPRNRIRFAQTARLAFVEDQGAAFVGGVNALQIDRSSGEVVDDVAIRGNDNHVVVFLQGDDGFAKAVDRDILRFWVGTGDFCQTGQVHNLQGRTVQPALCGVYQHQVACWQLWDDAVVQVFVALVLNRNGDERAVLGFRDRVRLTTQIAGGVGCSRCNVDGLQHAGRCGVGFRGVYTDVGRGADHGHGCWFTSKRDVAQRLGVRRVSDVDTTQGFQRAVGVNQSHAVGSGIDDFRRGFACGVFTGRHVQRGGKACDAVEIHFGVRETGGQGSGRCQADKARRHHVPPCI